MAFYLYKREEREEGDKIKEWFQQVRNVKLAGYNTIYKLWEQKGKPLDQGWHITRNDIATILTEGNGNHNSHRLIIDFYPNPKSKQDIALIEVLDIYAYTYKNQIGKASWTVLMLRLRRVREEEFKETEITKKLEDEKKEFSIDKREDESGLDVFEFIYLLGEKEGFTAGQVGRFNAAFIDKDARHYFKNFFCE